MRVGLSHGTLPLADGMRGLDGIDYGEISKWWDQYPGPVPNLPAEKLLALEELGDVDLVRQAIIHQAGLWRPNR
jgi:hypothetical protein